MTANGQAFECIAHDEEATERVLCLGGAGDPLHAGDRTYYQSEDFVRRGMARMGESGSAGTYGQGLNVTHTYIRVLRLSRKSVVIVTCATPLSQLPSHH